MKKTVPVRIRVSLSLLDVLEKIAIETNCSVAQLIRSFIFSSVRDIKKNDVPDDLMKELKLFVVQYDRTKNVARLYIVKNMYKRILDMAMSSYFITKSINMGAINLILDLYVKEFELYDDETKKIIGIDFKMTVKRLRDQNFLLEQSQTIKKLKMIEGR